jgi:hypothetical protein
LAVPPDNGQNPVQANSATPIRHWGRQYPPESLDIEGCKALTADIEPTTRWVMHLAFCGDSMRQLIPWQPNNLLQLREMAFWARSRH